MPSNAMACVVSSTERNCINTTTTKKHYSYATYVMEHLFENLALRTKSDLQKGKVLVLVDLNSKNWVSWGLGQATQTHLSIEKVHHRLLLKTRKQCNY